MEELLMSIMFIFFELTSCTREGAWSSYIMGAIRLCELMGPREFCTGIAHRQSDVGLHDAGITMLQRIPDLA
jgi:hypothetical protein